MKQIHIPLWLIILVIIAGGFFWKFDSNRQKKLNEQNLAVSDSLTIYKTMYNQEVASKQVYVTQTNKFKFLNDSLRTIIKKGFKEPETVIITKTVTRIDTLYKPYKVPINFQFKRNFVFADNHYRFSGISTNLGIRLDTVRIYNKQSIVFGEKKRGIIYADIVNSNPYIYTTDIKSYTYKPKKKWYEKWYITIPAGVAAGAIIAK